MKKTTIFYWIVLLVLALSAPDISFADTQTFNLKSGWDYYDHAQGSGSVVRTYNPGTGELNLTLTLNGASSNTPFQFGFDIFRSTPIYWFGEDKFVVTTITREGVTADISGFVFPAFKTNASGDFSLTYSLYLTGPQSVPADTYNLQYGLSSPAAGGFVWYRTGSSFGIGFDSLKITSTPIPGSIWLIGSGLVGFWGYRRKIRK